MKFRSKRATGLVAFVAAAALALSACGGDDDDSDSTAEGGLRQR